MRSDVLAGRTELDAMQAQFASKITAQLSAQASELPQDLSERLRVAREQAVARAQKQRAAAAAPATVAVANGVGTLILGSSADIWWRRLAAAAPLAVLVLGLFFIQKWHDQVQIRAAAEVDAALLADDLPPSAYSDPAFTEFLKQRAP